MESRRKRKLDANVLKDVLRNKKPKCPKGHTDGSQKLAPKCSQAVSVPCGKNTRKRKLGVHDHSAVSEKERTLDSDVKRTHGGLHNQHSKCLSKFKTQNTSQRPQQSNVCVKVKMVPENRDMDCSKIMSNSKKPAIVNPVQGIQRSMGKTQSEVKSRDYSSKTGVLNSRKSSEPSLKPENFSSNWKSLQKVLQKQTKKKKPTFQHKKQKRGLEKKPHVKEDKESKESESKIWFDDVDDILIESLKRHEEYKINNLEKSATDGKSDDRLVKSGSFKGLTRTLAVDCEMVGVGEGGKDSILARVSVVNHFGQCVFDKFVKPREPVTDYRTHVSGIRPENLKNGEEFSVVQEDVSRLFKDRILVGHAIENDLKVLFLSHPRKMIRDTSTYKPFRKLFNGRKPALRKLAEKLLLVKVQEGEHNSVQDAQAAMRLYTMYRRDWEKEINMRRKTKQALLKTTIDKKTVAKKPA